MKKTLLIILIFKFSHSIAQSKKEQIELLKIKVDSLKIVIENERNSYLKKTQDLDSIIEININLLNYTIYL
jgi:hypothetical protein